MIGWAKCLSACTALWNVTPTTPTDGAPSIMGCRNEFIASIKKVNLSVEVIHCMLYRKNLAPCELSETFCGVMKDFIQIVNFVKA